MPFLKLLMPLATSPIMSENRPLPNSSITTMPTISQCQMLNDPMAILQFRKTARPSRPPPQPVTGAPSLSPFYTLQGRRARAACDRPARLRLLPPPLYPDAPQLGRASVGGTGGSVRIDQGGRRSLQKKK